MPEDIISIHTPTRGVTKWQKIIIKDSDFNPHSHEGSDVDKDTNSVVGIHFNPHSHEGSDVRCLVIFMT